MAVRIQEAFGRFPSMMSFKFWLALKWSGTWILWSLWAWPCLPSPPLSSSPVPSPYPSCFHALTAACLSKQHTFPLLYTTTYNLQPVGTLRIQLFLSLMHSAEMVNKLWKLWEETNVWTDGYWICLLQFFHLSKSGERVTQVSHHG